ncbi:MAG: SRPBCC domain-containing protein [Acidimicrobiales bacterium]
MGASPMPVVPVTIRVERSLDHRPRMVFDAYADIDQRTQWMAPPDDLISFESHDFRAGASDHFVRPSQGKRSFSGTTRYEHIVDDEHIVFTERLTAANDQLLAISLVSWFLVPSGPGTLLTITDHTASVVGSRPIEGARYRYEVMVDRLARHLAGRVGGFVDGPDGATR